MSTRAATISLQTLARSVESAVKTAAARYEITVDKSTLLDRWEIIGRRLRGVRDMNVAFRFATDVARAIRVPGVSVSPVLGKVGPDILVGFIERSRLTKVLAPR